MQKAKNREFRYIIYIQDAAIQQLKFTTFSVQSQQKDLKLSGGIRIVMCERVEILIPLPSLRNCNADCMKEVVEIYIFFHLDFYPMM